MAGTEAYLVSGAGNDFLALVAPSSSESTPAPETINAWCRRGLSVGADGLFVLGRTDDGAHMRYWNADGGHADLCLNGSRCAAQLAFHLGWGDEERLILETSAGRLSARRIDEDAVALALPDIIGPAEQRRLPVDDALATDGHIEAWSIAVGVPHLVVPWPSSLAGVPIDRLGAPLRRHPALGPDGANVDFVFVTGDGFDIRTFERGVEGETLACGTGVVAGAAACVARGDLEVPISAQTAGGFTLSVEGEIVDGRLRSATLGGDARILGRLQLFPAAARVPQAARWRD